MTAPMTREELPRVPEMEKYIEIRPVVMDGSPDAHNVFLKVTNQTFCVTPFACETKEEAEWFRDMLCVALGKVVADGTPAQGMPSLPEPYWLPFKVVGGCIRDAKDNYVAELSSPFGADIRDAMAAFLVAAANTFLSTECGEGK